MSVTQTDALRSEAAVGATARPTFHAWLTLALLGVAYFFSLLDRQILTVLVDPIKADLGISDTQFGLLQGLAFAVFYTTFGIPVAMLADRWNRSAIISSGVIVWSVSTCFAAFARSFGVLFGARVGVGLGEACLAPAAYSMFSDLFDRRVMGRVIGVFHMLGTMGVAASAALGGVLYGYFVPGGVRTYGGFEVHPWGMTLMTVGLPGIVLGFAILWLIREPVRQMSLKNATAGHERAGLWSVLQARHGFLLRLLVGSSLISMGSNGLVMWNAPYLMRDFGLSPAQAGIILGITLAIPGIAGPLLGGALGDTLYRRMGERGATLVFAGGALLFAIPCAAIPLASTAIGAALLLGTLGLGIAVTLSQGASVIQLVSPVGVRAQVSAIWLCLNNIIGLGGGSLAIGMMNDRVFGLNNIGSSIGVVGLCAALPGALLIATLLRRRMYP